MSLNRVNAFLESQHIRVLPGWLNEQLVTFQNQRGKIGEQQLSELIREEYLKADFRTKQVIPPAFPSNIEGAHQTTLFQQSVVLQVLDVIDVGVSAQHLLDATLRHSDPNRGRILAEEEKSEGKFPRSMLKFTFTDGVQEAFAMEYRPLNNVDIFLPLGSKILVNNVKVLRGVLLLESNKFSVLGGQVESLNQKSLVQRLRSRLNLEDSEEYKNNNVHKNNDNDQNQPHITNNSGSHMIIHKTPQTTQNSNGFQSPQTVNLSGTTVYKSAISDQSFNSIAISAAQKSETSTYNQIHAPTSTPDKFDIDSDIEFQDHILDNLLEQESLLFDDIPPDFVDKSSPPPSTDIQLKKSTFTSFNTQPSHARAKAQIIPIDDGEDFDDFDSMEFFKLHGDIDNTPLILGSPKQPSTSISTKPPQPHISLTHQPKPEHELLTNSDNGANVLDVIDLCDDDDFLLDESVQDMLNVAEKLTSLRELENIRKTGTNSTYVKATVNRFGKFSFDGLSFSVILTIKDTDNINAEVILSNELVQKFLSRTPEEFKTLTVPERRTEFQKILIDFKTKLTNLTAIMKLDLGTNDKPIIIEIRDTF